MKNQVKALVSPDDERGGGIEWWPAVLIEPECLPEGVPRTDRVGRDCLEDAGLRDEFGAMRAEGGFAIVGIDIGWTADRYS